MKNFKYKLTSLLVAFVYMAAIAQTEGVSIKTTVGPPHASAMLDVESSSKGILIPRVSISDTADMVSPISAPAEGLLVYNNINSGNAPKGFYYCTGTVWKKLSSSDLWQKVPSTNLNIIYNNGQVIVEKNTANMSGGTAAMVIRENTSTSSAGQVLQFTSNCPSCSQTCGVDYHAWTGGGGDRLHITSSLQVDGNVYGSNLVYTSDSTLKRDVVEITDAINNIKLINPVSYYYIDNTTNGDPCSTTNFKLKLDTDQHTGFLAQNIERVYPHAVEEINGKKMVRYIELIAPLMQAVKDQQTLIENQQATIEDLINRVNLLEK
jgi:hypothetical protein